jgi:hypothetical protein
MSINAPPPPDPELELLEDELEVPLLLDEEDELELLEEDDEELDELEEEDEAGAPESLTRMTAILLVERTSSLTLKVTR